MTVKKSSFAEFAARTHPRIGTEQKKSSIYTSEIFSDEYLDRLRHLVDEQPHNFGEIENTRWSLGSWEMMEPPRPINGEVRARLIPDGVFMNTSNDLSEPDEEEDIDEEVEEEQEEEETEYEDDESE